MEQAARMNPHLLVRSPNASNSQKAKARGWKLNQGLPHGWQKLRSLTHHCEEQTVGLFAKQAVQLLVENHS